MVTGLIKQGSYVLRCCQAIHTGGITLQYITFSEMHIEMRLNFVIYYFDSKNTDLSLVSHIRNTHVIST